MLADTHGRAAESGMQSRFVMLDWRQVIRAQAVCAVLAFELILPTYSCVSQTVDELYTRIARKVEGDSSYSNLYVTPITDQWPLELKRFNGESVRLSAGSETSGEGENKLETSWSCELVFLDHLGRELSPVPISIVKKISTIESTRRKGGGGGPPQATTVYDLRDFMNLRQTGCAEGHADCIYQTIVNLVYDAKRSAHSVRPLRQISEESRIGHRSVSEGNEDYLNYAKVHSSHLYLTQGKGADTTRTEREISGITSGWYLDARMNLYRPLPSRISVSHSILSSPGGLGILGFGGELGLSDDRVLNLLPYQSPYWTGGIRLWINFSGSPSSLANANFLDMKGLLRKSWGSTDDLLKWVNGASPFFSAPAAKLNVPSGGVLCVSTSKLWFFDWPPLPAFNYYISGGSKDFDRPFIKLGDPKKQFAYYSNVQQEATLSFYWNTNSDLNFYNGTGKLLNQFRMDIGVGAYDIWRVDYDTANKVSTEVEQVSLGGFRPLISLEYTHASETAKFGAGARFFDNRFTFGAWIKVLSIEAHELRVESTYITAPVGRPAREWETSGGSLLHLRYRYGF